MTDGQANVSSGSHTVTISDSPQLLQLRASQQRNQEQVGSSDKAPRKKERSKVRWDEKVIDNENMNKKKTKICCIFHPNQNFEDEDEEEHNHEHKGKDDSSSSSSSSSDEDEGKGFEERRKARLERRKKKLNHKRDASPNAYEIQPDYSEYRDKYLKQTQ